MILRIDKLCKSYYRGKFEIPALRNVSLDISEGEFVSIIGKSGSGKSTLLNLIGGLDTTSSGHILFRDRDLSTMSKTELAKHRRFSVGMIFQSFNLIPSRTALENISLALTFGGVPRRLRKARAEEVIRSVGLVHRMDHKPTELSGGEAQRIAIARALANNPAMVLADEPTGNLDSVTSSEIIDLLQELNQKKGISVLMITHDKETASRISNKVIRLVDGSIANEQEKTNMP